MPHLLVIESCPVSELVDLSGEVAVLRPEGQDIPSHFVFGLGVRIEGKIEEEGEW